MEQRILGRTGIQVGAIGLGTEYLLKQPPAVEARITAGEAELAASPLMKHGGIYLGTLGEVSAEIVAANLEQRPVYYCPASDGEAIQAFRTLAELEGDGGPPAVRTAYLPAKVSACSRHTATTPRLS